MTVNKDNVKIIVLDKVLAILSQGTKLILEYVNVLKVMKVKIVA